MSTGRTILLARTTDGISCSHFSERIVEHAGRIRLVKAPDPSAFGDAAIALWSRWASRVPHLMHCRLVAEAGEVSDDDERRYYQIARVDGAILPDDEDTIQFNPPVAWTSVLRDLPIILGASATLVLTDFALNGFLSANSGSVWPFGDGFELFDTDDSPYPPQGFAPPPDDVLLRPTNAFPEVPRDDLPFIIACRHECWQRPIDALYNVRRRNLRLAHSGPLAPPVGPHLVLDTLTAEVEPSLDEASFLARATIHEGDRRVSPCCTMLAAKCHVAALLRAVSGPAGPAAAACICDPIEGDVYGYAPPLTLRRGAPIVLEDAGA